MGEPLTTSRSRGPRSPFEKAVCREFGVSLVRGFNFRENVVFNPDSVLVRASDQVT